MLKTNPIPKSTEYQTDENEPNSPALQDPKVHSSVVGPDSAAQVT
jgi:hypothetical protein